MLRYGSILAILCCGMLLGHLAPKYLPDYLVAAQTQEKAAFSGDKIMVEGHGRAYTGWSASDAESFRFFQQDGSDASFTIVPKGKKLILTDVLYHPQGNVSQDITVNLAESTQNANIMFQVRVSPSKSEEVSFCTGYSVEAGKSVKAHTDANAKGGQFISVSVTGYLIDE